MMRCPCHRRLLALIAGVLVLCGSAASARQPALSAPGAPLTVYAAASLAGVIEPIGQAFTQRTGVPVQVSLASSGTLARQIEAGAPADVFISADTVWMDYLAERQLLRANSRHDLLTNRLVLIAPAGSAVTVQMRPGLDLAPALGAQGRLALADPQSVPAGRYAQAALTRFGAWNSVAGRLAPAENVRAALAFVARGEAPLGIVYATDALAEPRVRVVARFPATSHPPIVYPAAIPAGSRHPAAAGFVAALRAPAAAERFRAAGFGLAVRPR